MNITIKINTDSESFEADAEAEVTRILRALAARIDLEGIDIFALRDINGDIVGSCRCD